MSVYSKEREESRDSARDENHFDTPEHFVDVRLASIIAQVNANEMYRCEQTRLKQYAIDKQEDEHGYFKVHLDEDGLHLTMNIKHRSRDSMPVDVVHTRTLYIGEGQLRTLDGYYYLLKTILEELRNLPRASLIASQISIWENTYIRVFVGVCQTQR